jgi:hypothetical protein
VAQKWRVLRPTEDKLRRAIGRAFVAQGTRLLAGRATDWIAAFDTVSGATTSLFLDPIQDAAQVAMVAGARTLIAELGVEIAFNLRNPRAVAYLDAHGADLVAGINTTTRDSLRALLRQATDEGWSYNRTARAIRTQFNGFAGKLPQAHIVDRASLVALTESGMAYEAGNAIVVADLQDAGLVMEKSWLTVNDNRTSAGCRENQAAGWIPYEENFPSGHAHPLRFPGCRCSALYRRKPD